MAFLDNSGDIILDAVLTDAGRQRMARGNFNIVKFALGDEEINYALYNSSHPSGSAFNDLEIMQTPILEAFTNNTSTMKSKLISISRPNLLYLPILRLNEKTNRQGAGLTTQERRRVTSGTSATLFCIAVDTTTVNDVKGTDNALPQGCMAGTMAGNEGNIEENIILIDQGKETNGAESITATIESGLLETQYIIQIDHRLGSIAPIDSGADIANYSFVDDDDIATYYFGIGDAGGIVQTIDYFAGADADDNRLTDKANITPFNGPLGTNVRFKIRSSELLRQSDLLFTEIGGGASTTTLTKSTGGSTSGLRFIDSLVRVTGVTTGYSLDIPVRFLKK